MNAISTLNAATTAPATCLSQETVGLIEPTFGDEQVTGCAAGQEAGNREVVADECEVVTRDEQAGDGQRRRFCVEEDDSSLATSLTTALAVATLGRCSFGLTSCV